MTEHTEIINELRTIYREHLFTNAGRKEMRDAIEMKKEWKKTLLSTDAQFNTDGVNIRFLPYCFRGKTTCIEITPIGLNNMCHLTSELFEKKHPQVKKVFGFNIIACPCGRIMSLEIHSVNKIGETLYDFTRDFNDEKRKYFYPINTSLNPREYIQIFSANPITIDKGCRCPIRWTSAKEYIISEDELETRIGMMERMIVRKTPFGVVIS